MMIHNDKLMSIYESITTIQYSYMHMKLINLFSIINLSLTLG